MGFVEYNQDLKVITVKLSLPGWTLARINRTLDKRVSNNSMARWKAIYCRTWDIVRDPATYKDRGRPFAFTTEEAEFVLAALDAKPTLYLNEIQSHIEAMTGTCHPLSTISDLLKFRLHLAKKFAQTVHPAQCEMQRAEFNNTIGRYPPNYLVFLGECFPFHF
jgi:hypothetical protein